MHTRQGGAAHINIFYFLIILVMFFGVLGFGYMQLTKNAGLATENATLRLENAQLDVNNRLLRHFSEDISAAIDLPGEYTGRELVVYESELDVEPKIIAETLQNVAAINQLEERLRLFSARVGVPEGTGIPTFLDRIATSYDGQTQRLANSEAERQQLSEQIQTANASSRAALDAAAQRERELNTQVTTSRDDLESQIAQKDNLMTQLTANVRTVQAELSTEREERAIQVRQLNDERNQVQAQNDAIRQKYSLINPPQAPDGRVITASRELGRAIIDLGRKDMLQPGTVFRITSPDGGGVAKALGTVITVGDEQSDMVISELVDPFAPVTRGDLISNEIFSPNIRRNVYLMGRFGPPYTKASVKALLERLGNTVLDELKPGVDLVVIGNELLDAETGTLIPLDETPEYRLVQELSIEVTPLNKIRDLLKFDDR